MNGDTLIGTKDGTVIPFRPMPVFPPVEDHRDVVAIVEHSLTRELWHIELQLHWGDHKLANVIYTQFFIDPRLPTSPEIQRLQAEALGKLVAAGARTKDETP